MKNNRKSITFIMFFALLLICAMICGMAIGSVNLSLSRIIGAFMGTDRVAQVIMFDLRLPRVLAAALAGVGLSAAGCLLQTVTDNELCAPNIIGVNAGAGFAVMLISCLAPMLWRLTPLAAFLGAFITSILVISFSLLGRYNAQKSSIVLAGVAVSSILNGGISLLSIKFPDVLSSYMAFSVGGFSGVALRDLLIPAVMIGAGFVISMILAQKLQMLCLGDEIASTLGVNVTVLRLAAIAIASIMCAAVVTFAGLLGFVGLVVPNIIKKLLKGNLRTSLPAAALSGAALVVFSDLAGRVLFAPSELPAGIIMAFIGAPFFLWLLIRRRKNG